MTDLRQGREEANNQRAVDLPKLDLTLLPQEAREQIITIGRMSDVRRQEALQKGEVDAAIAAIALADITSRLGMATKGQVTGAVSSWWYAPWMKLRQLGGRTGTVTTSGAIVGGAPTAVGGLDQLMRLAQNASNIEIPRVQALVATAFTLSLLTAAVAGPITHPWRFKVRNRDESLKAAKTLELLFSGEGLERITERAMHGDVEGVERASKQRIDELLGRSDSQTFPLSANRVALSGSLLAAAAALGVFIGASAKSWTDASQAYEREMRRNPGLAIARAANPKTAAQDFMSKVWENFSLQKGTADIARTFGPNLAKRTSEIADPPQKK